MLMLAGLMGMMLVGASAFIGLDRGEAVADGPVEPDETEATVDLLATVFQEGILAGTDGADEITGTSGDDQIGGYSGDDTLWGRDGDDELRGGTGADLLSGQNGADTLLGGDDEDVVYGSDGDDLLFGQMGQDLLSGGSGADIIIGGAGLDTLLGGSGDDVLHGGLGMDTATGGAGADTIFGGSGDDWISGFQARLGEDDGARDYLNGGEGADTILGDAGDILSLGEGADTAVLGDWIGPGDDAAQIIDFRVGEDQILLLYPEASDEPQDVSIADAADGVQIVLDGVVVALLPPGTLIGMSDIALMPDSAAGALLRTA